VPIHEGEACDYCVGEIPEDVRVRERVSTGFGHSNQIMLWFCSKECRVLLDRSGHAKDRLPYERRWGVIIPSPSSVFASIPTAR
jgi:hypothetical protein